uniref:transposase n=1 Tax=Virgibacillus senegalensis TaxID=1499679 RepID=UPI00069EF972|nr:transposase [Virgibacillus senegalensis]
MKWMRASNIEAFRRVRKTFMRWKQEILQSFMYPFHNGYIKGINHTIKVLKRDSFGIKDVERLKHKILWQQAVKKAL